MSHRSLLSPVLWSRVLLLALLCSTTSIATAQNSYFANSIRADHSASGRADTLGRTAGTFAGAFAGRALEFIPNRGQLVDQFGSAMPEVLYTVDGRGVRFYFTKNSMHYVFRRSSGPSLTDTEALKHPESRFERLLQDTVKLCRTDVAFIGANPDARIEASDEATNYLNYYLGHCRLSNVPVYHAITYHDLYPGIDVAFYAKGGEMKYDFIVHPGADPSRIRMKVSGADTLALRNGALHVTTPLGYLDEQPPFSYQQHGSDRREIPSAYTLSGDTLAIAVGAYDRSRTLVIDPQRLWGTYYGDAGDDRWSVVCVDKSDDPIIALNTTSTANIATTGAYQTTLAGNVDIAIVKFSPNGSILWATYYGGAQTEGVEGIVCDTGGAIYIAGSTNSFNGVATTGAWLTTRPGNESCLMAKFTSSGALGWGSYYGAGRSQFLAIAMDSSYDLILGGYGNDSSGIATANTFQSTNSTQSQLAFVVKFTRSCSRVWGTYFGQGNTYLTALSVDRANNIYSAGWLDAAANSGIASAGAFQTTRGGMWPGFLVRFRPDGTRHWSTYYRSQDTVNGAGHLFVETLATDARSDVVLGAYTDVTSGMTTAGAWQPSNAGSFDCNLALFDSTGARKWSTYLGGDGWDNEYWQSLFVTPDQRIYLAGQTYSTSGLGTSNGYMQYSGGWVDAFLDVFDTAGQRTQGTFYGGTGDDYGFGCAVDSKGHPLLTGLTHGTDGIASSNGARTTYSGGNDVFLVKFCDTIAVPIVSSSTAAYCLPMRDTLHATPGYASYQWRLGGSDVQGATDSIYVVPGSLAPGTYKYTVLVDDPYLCYARSDTMVVVVKEHPIAHPGPARAICRGTSVQIGDLATGGATPYIYSWYPTSGLSSSTIAQPIASPSQTTTYYCFVTGADGCQGMDSVVVTVHPVPVVVAGPNVELCLGSSLRIGHPATSGTAPYSYVWNPSTSLDTAVIAQPLASPTTTTTYHVIVTDRNGCSTTDSVVVHVNTPPSIALPKARPICQGDGVQLGISATGGTAPYTYSWIPSAGLSDPATATPVASPTLTTRYHVVVTDSKGCHAEDSVDVVINARPRVKAAGAASICLGSHAQLSCTASGGVSPYRYAWSPAADLLSPNAAKTFATPQTSTTYTVTVTDSNGCTWSDSVRVTVNDPPLAHAGTSLTICPGDTVTIGDIATGGTPPYTYSWSPTQYLSNAASATTQAFPPSSTTYTLSVRDANGCEGSADVTVNIEEPHVTIQGPSSACPQSTVAYHAVAPAGSTCTWSLSGGGLLLLQASTTDVSVTWTTAGTWRLTVQMRSALGCAADTTIDVTVTDKLVPAVLPAGPVTLCTGDTVTLYAEKGYASYLWSDGTRSDSLRVTRAGSFTVSVVGSGGCTGTSLPVVVNAASEPKPIPTFAAYRTTLCQGDSETLSLTDTYSQYLWSTGARTPSITIGKTGTYFVTVTNASGCQGTSVPIEIDVAPIPKLAILPDTKTDLCEGETVVLSATPNLLHYRWSTGDTTPNVTVSQSGRYTVSAESGAGCRVSAGPVEVEVHNTPSAAILGARSVCPDASATYSAAPGSYTYQWSVSGGTIQSGTGSATISVLWPASGSGGVSLTVTDPSSGCTASSQLAITIGSELHPVIAASGPLSFCDGDSVTLDAGAGYATYQWYEGTTEINGATTERLTVRTSGDYSVLVRNGGSCQGTSSPVTVAVFALPAPPVITASGNVLSSTPAAQYQWSLNNTAIAGATSQTYAPQQAGNYSVTIWDAHGCSSVSVPYYFVTTRARATVAVPPSLRANPGDAVRLPLELTNSQDLNTSGASRFVAQVRFDNSLLVSSGSTPRGSVTARDRVIQFTGQSALAAGATSGTIATLDLTATLGLDTCTAVSLDTFYFSDADVEVTRENGSFCLDGVCIADGHVRLIDPAYRVSLGAARPNPSNERVTIDYELAEAGPTRLVVQDMLGRTVMVLRDEPMKPGSYSQEFDVHTLASGSYRYLLITPSQALAKRMEVVK